MKPYLKQIKISMYKDEFNTQKQLNAVVLEEVLRRLPSKNGEESALLNEERSALFDSLFDEAIVAIDKLLGSVKEHKLVVGFNPRPFVKHFDVYRRA